MLQPAQATTRQNTNTTVSALEAIIKAQIRQNGPMRISDFMALALGHPHHGYYMTRDPFGVQGDFTTAPEISQLFGEMVGAWLYEVWVLAGRPDSFILLECGPGRGTLMADIMRVARLDPSFEKAMSVHLLEMSPVLKMLQQKTLQNHAVQWHETLDTVPDNQPLFVIGNEFFDALPIRQIIYQDGQWRERCVALNTEEDMGFVAAPLSDDIMACANYVQSLKPVESDIYEHNFAAINAQQNIVSRIKSVGGVQLFLDYGYTQDRFGNTLQAVKGHNYANILEDVGNQDITAHVDFNAILKIAKEAGLHVFPVQEQGDFLKALGLEYRAQQLQQFTRHRDSVFSAYDRLTHKDQMGRLFKVFAATSYDIALPGFEVEKKG